MGKRGGSASIAVEQPARPAAAHLDAGALDGQREQPRRRDAQTARGEVGQDAHGRAASGDEAIGRDDGEDVDEVDTVRQPAHQGDRPPGEQAIEQPLARHHRHEQGREGETVERVQRVTRVRRLGDPRRRRAGGSN